MEEKFTNNQHAEGPESLGFSAFVTIGLVMDGQE